MGLLEIIKKGVECEIKVFDIQDLINKEYQAMRGTVLIESNSITPKEIIELTGFSPEEYIDHFIYEQSIILQFKGPEFRNMERYNIKSNIDKLTLETPYETIDIIGRETIERTYEELAGSIMTAWINKPKENDLPF